MLVNIILEIISKFTRFVNGICNQLSFLCFGGYAPRRMLCHNGRIVKILSLKQPKVSLIINRLCDFLQWYTMGSIGQCNIILCYRTWLSRCRKMGSESQHEIKNRERLNSVISLNGHEVLVYNRAWLCGNTVVKSCIWFIQHLVSLTN